MILPVDVGDDVIETHEHSSPVTNKLVPEGAENIPSNSSLTAASLGSLTSREGRNLPRKQSLDVFTLCEKTTKARGDKGASFRARHFPKVDNKHGADVRLGPEPTLVSRLRFPKRTEFWQPSSMLELG